MKNSGKILRAGFWIILAAVIVVGYFKISEYSESEHLKYIPNNVKGVLVFDGRQVSKKVVERFQYNPGELKDLIPSDYEDLEEVNPLDLGIHPYHKIAAFHFDIADRHCAALLIKCDSRKFMGYFEGLHGEDFVPILEDASKGVIAKRFKSSIHDATVIAGPGIGIYCSKAKGEHFNKTEIKEILVPYLISAIAKNESGLLAQNESFAAFKEKNHDIGYWSQGENHSFGALTDDFLQSQTYLDFEQGKIDIKSELKFEGECPIKKEIKPINSNALFAFSFMANQESANHFVNQNIPSTFHTYFTDFSGNFFLEVTGHRLYQGYHIESEFDEEFNEIEVVVPNDEETAFPEFIAIFSVNDPVAYNAALDADTTVECIDGFYEWEPINGMKCYISTKENDVCFSNSKDHIIDRAGEDKNLGDLYATYSMVLDFENLKNHIPLSGDMGLPFHNVIIQQGFGQLNFKRLEVNATEISDNAIIGEGIFEFNDSEKHSIDALVELANRGYQMRSIIENMIIQTANIESK
mgnify:CR=1 FL=1